MICPECGKRPATVHVTKIVNNQRTEMHLCQQCAQEKGELDFMIEPKFSIQDLLTGMLGYEGGWEPTRVGPEPNRCKLCGLSYREFARTGRLGCGECYRQFGNRLEPLLRRIHGSTYHSGKVPKRAGGTARLKREIEKLRAELQQHVDREEFEQAARLRDRIRKLEVQLNG